MKTSLPSSSSGWMFFLFPHPVVVIFHLFLFYSSFNILVALLPPLLIQILAFERTSLNASLIHFHFIIAPTTTIARLLNWWRLKTFSKRLRDDENLMMKKYFSFPSHADVDDDDTMMSKNRNRVWTRRWGKFSVFFLRLLVECEWMIWQRREGKFVRNFLISLPTKAGRLNVNDGCVAADLTSTKRKLWEMRWNEHRRRRRNDSTIQREI